MTQGIRAYSYLRCSTPEQLRGDSFRRQAEAANRYARENHLTLDDTLELDDRGVSAFKGANREAGLGRFLGAVEDGRVPVGSFLLVENLDRLSREKARRALRNLEDIVDAGIVVVTLSDGAVYSTETLDQDPIALMKALMVMMRAHEESSLKSSRVARAWEAKRQRARDTREAMTERCPAWLRIEQGRYVEIAERADLVRWMFERTIADEGKRKIVSDIRDRGIAPWGRGVTWHESYVQKILMSEATFGRYSPLKGKAAPIDGYFPATVSEETYWSAQAARANRRTNMITVPPGKGMNILAGLAKCACGAGMHYTDKGARSAGPYLVCGSYRTAGECKNGSRWLFRLVIREIAYLGCQESEQGLAPGQVADTEAQERLAGAKARHEIAARRLAAVAEAIAAGAGASLATAHAAADIELASAKEALNAAETTARASRPVEPDVCALMEILFSKTHPIDDAQWRRDATIALRNVLSRVEFGTGRSIRIIHRTGETTPFTFSARACRAPGETYQEANSGWWDGNRDGEGRPTKRGTGSPVAMAPTPKFNAGADLSRGGSSTSQE